MAVGLGGPISLPSRLKLKLNVTTEPEVPAGGFQQACIAAPTSSMVLSGSALDCQAAPVHSKAATDIVVQARFIAEPQGVKWRSGRAMIWNKKKFRKIGCRSTIRATYLISSRIWS
jgi:hypothetical protein